MIPRVCAPSKVSALRASERTQAAHRVPGVAMEADGQASSTKVVSATGAKVTTMATGAVASAASPDANARCLAPAPPEGGVVSPPSGISPALSMRELEANQKAREEEKEAAEANLIGGAAAALAVETVEAAADYVKPTPEMEHEAVEDYMAAVRAQLEAGMPKKKIF